MRATAAPTRCLCAQFATGADNSGRYMLASATAARRIASAPALCRMLPNPPGTTIPKVGAALKPAPAPAAEPASEPLPPARLS